MVLTSSFYARNTVTVARDLLGKQLICTLNNQTITGLIIETEAYRAHDDPASHAYRGQTKRTQLMFGAPGHAYVYFIYGVWYCLNVTARALDQKAGAVLIRAVEPIDGIACMQQRRNTTQIDNLTNGPGKLAQAFGLTTQNNGIDMTCNMDLYICDVGMQCPIIRETPRIGIKTGQDKLWRFCIKSFV